MSAEQIANQTEYPIAVLQNTEALPSVTRRGKYILWHLPGNTPQEDLRLGIRNIQALFLERLPHFAPQFSRNHLGEIIEEERERARDFIIKAIGTQQKFDSVFGSSPHIKKAVPYFEGSHKVVIQKAFAPWGINFSVLDNPTTEIGIPTDWHGRSALHLSGISKEEKMAAIEAKAKQSAKKDGRLIPTRSLEFAIRQHYDGGIKQLRASISEDMLKIEQDDNGVYRYREGGRNGGTICWQLSDQSEEDNLQFGINNIRAIFLASFPDFKIEYPLGHDGTIDISRRTSARRFILEKIGSQSNFSQVIGRSALHLPYFRRSHLVAIQNSFASWGVGLTDIDIHDPLSIPRDSAGRIMWTLPGRDGMKDGKLTIKIMQTLFLKNYPDFESLFPTEDTEFTDISRKAEEFVLERCGNRPKFIEIFGNTPLDKNAVPEFEGSFIQALRRVFQEWGISFSFGDFRSERSGRGDKGRNFEYGAVDDKQIFLSLPQEQAWQVADSYWEYVKSYPDTKMDIPEYYAKVYLAQQT